MALLDAVAGSDRPLAAPDLVARAGVPRSTVHRQLAALAALGLVAREPDGKRYGPGPRLARLGLDALQHSSLRAERRAILQSVVAAVGETCNFTMLDGAEVVYLDRVEAHWPLRLVLAPGSHVPLHCTASGKLFLAMMPAVRRRRLLAGLPLTALTALTPRTLTDLAELERELVAIRAARVGVDAEEFLSGLIAVAVPVLDRRGRAVAAVALHAPTARMTLDTARSRVPSLREAAAALARTLDV